MIERDLVRPAAEAIRSDGHILVRHFLPDDLVAQFATEATTLAKRARRGELGDIRIYDDYPKIFGGLNVSGIERPLEHLPSFSAWLRTGELREVLEETIRESVVCTLIRLHLNNRFKWRGFWHQDSDKIGQSVVVVIYLNREKGFRLLGKNDVNPRLSVDKYCTDEREVTIDAEPGDVLFFDGALWHRGHSVAPRMHLHLKFEVATARTRELQDEIIHGSVPLNEQLFKPERAPSLRQWVNLFRYLIPSRSHGSIYMR